MFLTPTGSSSRLPGRGDRVCHMPSDTAKGQQDKHMASGIIETEANMYVGLCITLKSPFLSLSLPPLLAGHRLQVATKVTRHLVVETGAGHMPPLL